MRSRRPEQAQALVAGLEIATEVAAVPDLQAAVGQADIVSSTTIAR